MLRHCAHVTIASTQQGVGLYRRIVWYHFLQKCIEYFVNNSVDERLRYDTILYDVCAVNFSLKLHIWHIRYRELLKCLLKIVYDTHTLSSIQILI